MAHESAVARYPKNTATVQICVPMLGARYTVTRESETGTTLEQEFGARDILLVPAEQPHAVHWLRRAGIVSFQISERYVQETLDVPRLTLPNFLAVQDRFVTVAAAELYALMNAEEPITPVLAEALVVGLAPSGRFCDPTPSRGVVMLMARRQVMQNRKMAQDGRARGLLSSCHDVWMTTLRRWVRCCGTRVND